MDSVGLIFLTEDTPSRSRRGLGGRDRGCHGYGNRTPPKKQRRYYSGKHKAHTLKAQIVIHYCTGQILSTAYAAGAVHDFKLLKRTLKTLLRPVRVLADKGYQGPQRLSIPCVLPTKGNIPCGKPLSESYVDGGFGWSLFLRG